MNPFFDICDNTGLELEGSVFGTAFGGLNEPPAVQLSDINITLDVTLKEFYNGSRKTVTYERQVVGLDGRTVKNEFSSIDVYIRPGMLEST
jgi:DnaJ-class molecular chaperone